MSRENIFEKIGKFHNPKQELNRIEQLLKAKGGAYYSETYLSFGEKGTPYSIIEYVDQFLFKKWKNRGTAITCEDFWNSLGIMEDESVDYMLSFCEYAANVVYILKNGIYDEQDLGDEPDVIIHNIKIILNWYGYEIKAFPKQEKVLVVQKSAQALAVADKLPTELGLLVIEYNHFMLKGNLQRKKEILLALGRALEAKRNVLKGINMSLADKIFCLYNNLNLRHNNVEQGKNYHKTVDEMKPKQIESWYDELYQMVLLAYLLMENEKRNNEVQKLIQQINSEEKNNGQA